MLFCNTKGCVINNGTVTESVFEYTRGTKQGDPISPYLFVLVIEIMASMIRGNNDIKGFSLEEVFSIKILLFADDTTFFLRNSDSLIRVLEELRRFHEYSSLKINLEKSEIGWIGPKKEWSLTKHVKN